MNWIDTSAETLSGPQTSLRNSLLKTTLKLPMRTSQFKLLMILIPLQNLLILTLKTQIMIIMTR